ncbi:MAG: peptidoglycan DD-metalloendopeptidase family protein [Limnohabitans sp.]
MRLWLICWAIACVTLVPGCSTSGRGVPAPVEDRNKTKTQAIQKSPAESPRLTPKKPASATPTDVSNKPGFYTVKPGDTLIRIGLDHGQNWRDIIRWNAIENPNLIEVGQVLRVFPPSAEAASEPVLVKPIASPGAITSGQDLPASHSLSKPANANVAEPVDETVMFGWPASGLVQSTFDEVKNKGIDISGKLGDPVLAAADGRVVYAGAGLRGYGNLVIIKHGNNFLTAYAHNQILLVREEQSVKKGQKIAEMGNSESEQIKLHFEIRKLGKPIDPMKVLPNR